MSSIQKYSVFLAIFFFTMLYSVYFFNELTKQEEQSLEESERKSMERLENIIIQLNQKSIDSLLKTEEFIDLRIADKYNSVDSIGKCNKSLLESIASNLESLKYKQKWKAKFQREYYFRYYLFVVIILYFILGIFTAIRINNVESIQKLVFPIILTTLAIWFPFVAYAVMGGKIHILEPLLQTASYLLFVHYYYKYSISKIR